MHHHSRGDHYDKSDQQVTVTSGMHISLCCQRGNEPAQVSALSPMPGTKLWSSSQRAGAHTRRLPEQHSPGTSLRAGPIAVGVLRWGRASGASSSVRSRADQVGPRTTCLIGLLLGAWS